MTKLQKQQRALRRAIELMMRYDEKVPLSYGGELPEDIVVLQDLLVDVRQLPLPLEREAS
jgi:hypothetical protein